MTWFKKMTNYCRENQKLAALIIFLVLLIFSVATLLTSDDKVVTVSALITVIFLNIAIIRILR
ncbi:hypothetical protein [Klebsiella oxytoca]|uniref:hypothetical protein n=1 Tax=Klebsiella oxytoca TaxID=571 RepID=UPI00190EF077|nr:hypothetical protein [Klebsiella oxytoca]